ncbi:MAG: SPOR domain-containing protein [Rhizobium sp.]|nr:SPOR domain-containing protein [Rhizobium sp.]
MADNKLLLKRGVDDDVFAEDDPLAELARIASFEVVPVVRAPTLAQRREPAFDLEDELLKELEIYDQPVPPSASAAVPAVEPFVAAPPAEPAFELEHAFEPAPVLEPEHVDQPVIMEAVETFSDATDGHIHERPAAHPVFDLEDAILREFAAFDARSVDPLVPHGVNAEVVHQRRPVDTEVPAELHDVPDLSSIVASPVALDHGRDIYASFRDDDLDAAISGTLAPETDSVMGTAPDLEPQDQPQDHLEPQDQPELQAATADVAHAVEHVPPPVPVEDGYWADLAAHPVMDAAPTHAISDVAAADVSASEAPALEAPVLEAPAVEHYSAQPEIAAPAFEAAVDEVVSYDTVEAITEPEFVETASADVYVSTHTVPADDHGLDALLAEVDRYPVTDGPANWRVQSRPATIEDTERATPPVVQELVVPDVVAPSGGAVGHAETALPADVSGQAWRAADDVFDDSNFDIDLGEIELDLSDLDDVGMDASPEVISRLAEEPVEEPVIERAAETVDEGLPVPPQAAPAIVRADYASLPFDPTQIAEEDDAFAPIAEIEVPDLPPVHHDEKPTANPEYDLDLDSEMAQLFATAATQPAMASGARPPADDATLAAGGQSRNAAAGLDLDEFERALEEDFRRSFTENRSGSSPDRVALAPMHAEPRNVRGSRGTLLLASAAVAIVLFGGAGVYAYMSGETTILASTEPKVILADTDPVKIVPEDPGGKQVPNQNKAVYDRVSGTSTDEARQETLLTSNEEPIDVVQRTLMPEGQPVEDDLLAMATPTGDTVDPRLLPDEQEQDRVTTTSKVVSGVSPRKVKTMVVRPDGTLVEREVTEDDLQQQAANDAELMKIAQKAAQDAAIATDSQADDIAKAIENVPERLAPNDEPAAKVVTPAQDEDAALRALEAATPVEAEVASADPVARMSVETVPPETADQSVADTPPAEANQQAEAETATVDARPAEPVVVPDPVDTPVAETQAAAPVVEVPVERSIAVDTTQPVDTAEPVVIPEPVVAPEPVELAAGPPAIVEDAAVSVTDVEADAPVRRVKTTKITPVPEVRPVDQPVTVVGRVTDQGTVQRDAEAKPQEVALADPAKQQSAATTSVPAGSYVIQIASLPSEAEAQTSYTRLSAKFAGVIGGRGVDIRRAEIKNKGTYYRVRIPAGSKQEAQALCTQYKKAGGSCLVSR